MESQLIKSGSILSERDLVRVAAVIKQATAENTKAAYREVAAARVEHLTAVADGYLFYLESSKTDQDAAGEQKPILGKAGRAVADWLAASGITEGFLFRAITKGGKVTYSGIREKTVARIVQKRAAMAGLDPTLFAGHSLRSGFVTEAGTAEQAHG